MLSQNELGLDLDPEETGATFAENAAIKAAAFAAASGLPTVADDSGLCVDALGGAPGVYSARYCGRHGDDEANNDKLLEAMREVPAGRRGARFVSAVCLMLPGGASLTCMGECPGRVALCAAARGLRLRVRPAVHPRQAGDGGGRQAPQHRGGQLRPADPGGKSAISHPRPAPLEALEAGLDAFLKQNNVK